MAVSSARSLRIEALIDLAGLIVIFVGVTVLKGLVLVTALKVDPRNIPLSDPRVYAVEYLTPLLVLPALTWLLHRRGASWAELGLHAPASWSRFAWWVVGTTAAALVLNRLVRWLPTVWGGAWPASPFEALAGHTATLLVAGFYTLFLVGLTEELIFRGFLMSRLAGLFGATSPAWWVAAVVTALVFGAAHAQQGALGILNGSVLGLLFGAVYLVGGRSLWVLLLSHSLYDTIRAPQYFVR